MCSDLYAILSTYKLMLESYCMQILSRAREAFFFKPKILLKDLIKLTSLSGQGCHTGMEFTEQ